MRDPVDRDISSRDLRAIMRNTYLIQDALRTMLDQDRIEKYKKKLHKYEDNKTVLIIPLRTSGYWTEGWLCEWFWENYKKLGFSDIAWDRSEKYMKLKERMQFDLFPDFLVERNGEWIKLEVETFPYGYNYCHPHGYADIVLCYDLDNTLLEDVEVITLREFKGCRFIIGKDQVFDFLCLWDEEFNSEYEKFAVESLLSKMLRKDLKK